ncbi:MAG: hypothetical protein U0353_09495 [Sandaracinus sp.]
MHRLPHAASIAALVVLSVPACTPLRPLDELDAFSPELDAGRPIDAARDATSFDAPGLDAPQPDAPQPDAPLLVDAADLSDAPAPDGGTDAGADAFVIVPDGGSDTGVGDGGAGCTTTARSVTCTVPGLYEFAVPFRRTSVHVVAVGAGGGGYSSLVPGSGFPGGAGSTLEGDVTGVAGDTLTIVVGGGGSGGGSSMGCTGVGGSGGGLSGVFSASGMMLLVAGGGGGGSARAAGCDADAPCMSATEGGPGGDGFGAAGGGTGGRPGMGYPTFEGGATSCRSASGGLGGGGGGGGGSSGGGGGGGSGWPGGAGGRASFSPQPGHGGESAASGLMGIPTMGAAGGDVGVDGDDGSVTISW